MLGLGSEVLSDIPGGLGGPTQYSILNTLPLDRNPRTQGIIIDVGLGVRVAVRYTRGHTGLVCKFWRNLNLSNVLGHFFIWSIDIIHLPFLVTVLGFSLYIEWSRLYGWFDCLGSIEDNCLLFEISLILLIHDSHFTKYSEEYKICTSLSLNILYDVKGSGKIWKNCKISSQNILDNGKKVVEQI